MNSVKSVLGSYLGHLTSYVVSAATIVAGLDPKLVPAQYSFLVALAGLTVTAAHHGYSAGVAQAVVKAATDAIATAPAKLMVTAILLGVVASSSLGLTACATAPTPVQQGAVVAAVDIGTGLAISEAGKVTDPAKLKARAVAFKAIAVELKAVNDAGNATLATLAADLAPLVAKLPPADQLAAASLEAVLIPYLQSQIPDTANVQNTQTTVDLVLGALISACEAYGAPVTIVLTGA